MKVSLTSALVVVLATTVTLSVARPVEIGDKPMAEHVEAATATAESNVAQQPSDSLNQSSNIWQWNAR